MAIKYKWLAARLREQLPDYATQSRHRLPTEAELAAHYQVSRQTVRQALAVLTQEGLIESRQGSGSYLTGRLRDGAYNTIGILLPGDSQYLYPTFLYDLRTALHAEGFTLLVYKTEEKLSTEREILTEILSHPPRALIVDPVQSALFNPNLDLYHALLKKSIPVVFMRHPYPQLDNCPCILEDDISGGRILTEYLITQGHTMIGSLFCADDASGADRYRGMLEVIRDHRLPLPDDRAQWFSSFDLRQLFLAHSTGFIKKAVQESLHSCTAILCHNDVVAYELVRLLHEADDPNLAEICVVSFDHSYLCDAGSYPFLSLSHPAHAWEKRLTETVLAPLKGQTVSSSVIEWEPILG